MHVSWVILIVVLLVIGVVLRRVWESRQQSEERSEETSKEAEATAAESPGFVTQVTGEVRNRLQTLRHGFGGKPEQKMATTFRAWIDQAFTEDPAIQGWLVSLNDEQVDALVTHLQSFCEDMGFDFRWLLDNQLVDKPELAGGLAQIVLLYSRASYQAVALQQEVELFRIYHGYLENPTSRQNRELGEQLFGNLIEQGTSTVSLSEHFAASSRQRQQQIVETIQQVAIEQPMLFQNTLKQTLIARAMPASTNGVGQMPASTNSAGQMPASTNSAGQMPASTNSAGHNTAKAATSAAG